MHKQITVNSEEGNEQNRGKGYDQGSEARVQKNNGINAKCIRIITSQPWWWTSEYELSYKRSLQAKQVTGVD